MGLKLHHIDASGARGDLDGTPFLLNKAGDRFNAEIGAGEVSFRDEGDLGSAISVSHIRNAVYHVIARYRNFQRAGALIA